MFQTAPYAIFDINLVIGELMCKMSEQTNGQATGSQINGRNQ